MSQLYEVDFLTTFLALELKKYRTSLEVVPLVEKAKPRRSDTLTEVQTQQALVFAFLLKDHIGGNVTMTPTRGRGGTINTQMLEIESTVHLEFSFEAT